jgi:hypothetical protein
MTRIIRVIRVLFIRVLFIYTHVSIDENGNVVTSITGLTTGTTYGNITSGISRELSMVGG